MREIWKTIDQYPNYEVSNTGLIKNMKSGRLLQRYIKASGYLDVILYNAGKQNHKLVHRLVLETFGGPPPSDNSQCDHIDGDKKNNDYPNLEWVTPKQNIERAERKNMRPKARGESHGHAKIDRHTVVNIKTLWSFGLSLSEIKSVLSLDICKQQIHRIAKGTRWNHD